MTTNNHAEIPPSVTVAGWIIYACMWPFIVLYECLTGRKSDV